MTSRNATPCYPSSIVVRVLSERDNPLSHLKDHLVHLWHFKVLRCPTPGPACTTSSPSACSQWSTTSQSSLSWPPGFISWRKTKRCFFAPLNTFIVYLWKPLFVNCYICITIHKERFSKITEGQLTKDLLLLFCCFTRHRSIRLFDKAYFHSNVLGIIVRDSFM